jgi:hypothetical protein
MQSADELHCRCDVQADIVLLPFFERFQLALQLFQDYDLAGVQGGAVTQWMVSGTGNSCSMLGKARSGVNLDLTKVLTSYWAIVPVITCQP